MNFDINIWWHWVFVVIATLGSAWNACRVFFRAYDATSNPFHIPVFRFLSELAGSFAGWMSLWYLLPLALDCSGAHCEFTFSWLGAVLLAAAVLGILGWIPGALNHLADGSKRLFSN